MTRGPRGARPLRVLHCPSTVGGNAQQLARSERELGADSWSVAFQQSYMQYDFDEVLWSEDAGFVTQMVERAKLLRRALRDFDIVHFNFGETMFPQAVPMGAPSSGGYPRAVVAAHRWIARTMEFKDLVALRRAGKGIVVTFQGDDARQGDYSRAHFPITFATEVDEAYYTPVTDAMKRGRIARFGELADRIFSVNPDLLHVLPPSARFVPYAHVEMREWAARVRPVPVRPVVVHAPTHRAVKGTRYLMAAVQRLQAEGVDFELRLVEGMSYADARRVYAEADLLVDQLLAGWYGGLAVELMALGTPVICYLREGDLGYLPPGMRDDLPLINATPDTIYAVLREWLTTRKHELPARGMKSRAFVERWHDSREIARQMLQEYEAIIRRADDGARPALALRMGR